MMNLARPCLRLFFVVLVLGANGGFETVSASDDLRERLSEKIEPRLKSKELVGVVVGLIDPAFPRPLVFGFGKTAIEGGKTPDGESLFEIGSVTKVFTTTALAVLVEQGRVKLNEPVVDLLPKGSTVPSREGRAITLEDLATHSSGLPRIPPIVFARSMLGKDPYAEVGERDILDFLSQWKPARTAGERYEYSNLGSGLLGMALAHREGSSYADLIDSKISKPLRMKSTRLVVPEAEKGRRALPYQSDGNPADYWKFEALAGCGGLSSSVDDMLLFLAANLDPGAVARPLGPALLATQQPRRGAMDERTKIALGWHISESMPAGRPVFWHNGGTGGFRSFVAFVPATRRAVVILSNTNASVDSLGFDALRLLRDASAGREEQKTLKKPKKTG